MVFRQKMSLKQKLLIFKVIIIFISIFSLSSVYFYFRYEYKKEIVENIQSEIDYYKTNMTISLKKANKILRLKRGLFKNIHKFALKQIQENPNINLYDLQKI